MCFLSKSTLPYEEKIISPTDGDLAPPPPQKQHQLSPFSTSVDVYGGIDRRGQDKTLVPSLSPPPLPPSSSFCPSKVLITHSMTGGGGKERGNNRKNRTFCPGTYELFPIHHGLFFPIQTNLSAKLTIFFVFFGLVTNGLATKA